jgi:hypothetical protein
VYIMYISWGKSASHGRPTASRRTDERESRGGSLGESGALGSGVIGIYHVYIVGARLTVVAGQTSVRGGEGV